MSRVAPQHASATPAAGGRFTPRSSLGARESTAPTKFAQTKRGQSLEGSVTATVPEITVRRLGQLPSIGSRTNTGISRSVLL